MGDARWPSGRPRTTARGAHGSGATPGRLAVASGLLVVALALGAVTLLFTGGSREPEPTSPPTGLPSLSPPAVAEATAPATPQLKVGVSAAPASPLPSSTVGASATISGEAGTPALVLDPPTPTPTDFVPAGGRTDPPDTPAPTRRAPEHGHADADRDRGHTASRHDRCTGERHASTAHHAATRTAIRVAYGASNRAADRHASTDSTADRSTDGSAHPASDGSAHPASDGSAHPASDGAADRTAHRSAHRSAHGTAHGTADRTAHRSARGHPAAALADTTDSVARVRPART